MTIPQHQWVFRARVRRIVDGDTFDLTIDQGMHGLRNERVRLLGVDAPEVKGPERERGLQVTAQVTEWSLAAFGDWPFVIRTERDPDHFGRYLVEIWRVMDGASLNDYVREISV